MNKSDIGVVAVMYAVCLTFMGLTLQFPPEAQTYPLCLEFGLLALITIFLVVNLAKARRQGIINDLPEVFSGFLRNQFFMVLAGCVVYLALMFAIGFYLSSGLFLAAIMAYLRVRHLHIAITVVALSAIIWAVFGKFLNVPLPLGALFD
ncbi:MAG: tripartite tricarboxylate transporter TctB family protein [Succinivibrionaceae bacterium]|nr:tripartite tricarboxylate transporter TctB family protein [Succinivibrionaceae bacterium]